MGKMHVHLFLGKTVDLVAVVCIARLLEGKFILVLPLTIDSLTTAT
jgi:hypothetical protein